MPFKSRSRCAALLALLLIAPLPLLHAQQISGLEAGAHAPAFTLPDQAGKQQDLATLSGPNGLLLLFFRSADWCPFCKGQLVDLESAQHLFAGKGVGVAAVSYDSPAILADFARRRSITYALLSDSNSAVIDKFGIRNTEGTGMEAGIPYPGYYLIDRQGLIKRRYFETAYVNRLTAHHLYANLFGAAALPDPPKELSGTPHVTVTTSQSDSEVTPGSVVQLVVNITPAADTHLYAPGAEKQQYHVIALTFKPSGLYATTLPTYPKSELLNFPELKETVPVFNGPTAIKASVSAIVNRSTIPTFAHDPHLTVLAELEYQACTSTTCYPPVKLPVEWAVNLRPLDLDRAPKSIQHK